jgi:NAD-dependent dihydropyrimidine dehydrogenase PreA subunit
MFEIIVDEKKCSGCDKCPDACPKGPKVWKTENGIAVVMDVSYCINCGNCAAMCPEGAIKIKTK